MPFRRIAAAAVAVLMGAGAALAAGPKYSASDVSTSDAPGASTAPAPVVPAPATDTLALTAAQQHAVYQAVSRKDTRAKPPAGFAASIGAVVPKKVKLHPLPSEAASRNPVLRRYDYAMLDDRLLIVDPMDKKIVAIITQ